MARFLSPHPNYSIQVFEGNEQVVIDARGYAQTHALKKPVIANFQQGGLLDHELEIAYASFNFSGLPEGVNPATRVSVFDTEAYVQADSIPENEKDELLVQMDERLRKLLTLFPGQYIEAETPRKAAPWPSYDQDTVEDIFKFQERLQINPEMIRLYEVENQNRDEVVKAMELLENPGLAQEQEGEDIVVSA